MLYKTDEVRQALIIVGYENLADKLKEIAEHDCVDLKMCQSNMPPKDYLTFVDVLLELTEGRYLPEKLDCEDFNSVLDEFMSGVGDTLNYEMQNHEEIAELVTELMKLVKMSSKRKREKASDEEVFDEVCDVLCTTFVYGLKLGYTSLDMFNRMRYKFNRANQRYNENNEI